MAYGAFTLYGEPLGAASGGRSFRRPTAVSRPTLTKARFHRHGIATASVDAISQDAAASGSPLDVMGGIADARDRVLAAARDGWARCAGVCQAVASEFESLATGAGTGDKAASSERAQVYARLALQCKAAAQAGKKDGLCYAFVAGALGATTSYGVTSLGMLSYGSGVKARPTRPGPMTEKERAELNALLSGNSTRFARIMDLATSQGWKEACSVIETTRRSLIQMSASPNKSATFRIVCRKQADFRLCLINKLCGLPKPANKEVARKIFQNAVRECKGMDRTPNRVTSLGMISYGVTNEGDHKANHSGKTRYDVGPLNWMRIKLQASQENRKRRRMCRIAVRSGWSEAVRLLEHQIKDWERIERHPMRSANAKEIAGRMVAQTRRLIACLVRQPHPKTKEEARDQWDSCVKSANASEYQGIAVSYGGIQLGFLPQEEQKVKLNDLLDQIKNKPKGYILTGLQAVIDSAGRAQRKDIVDAYVKLYKRIAKADEDSEAQAILKDFLSPPAPPAPKDLGFGEAVSGYSLGDSFLKLGIVVTAVGLVTLWANAHE